MQIEIYSDVVCPWCWIGEQRLFQALEGGDFTVKWRAFQLDPQAESTGTPLVEWLGRKYGGEANALRMFANVTQVAAEDGLTMNFDKAVSANTLDAHRLIWRAEDQRSVVEALHKAHFTDGLDIGSRDVLDTIIPGAREFLESSEGVAEVRAELDSAREHGITGVPMFIFDGKYAISGAQDASTFREVIEEVRRRSGPIVLPSQGVCEDDSCTV